MKTPGWHVALGQMAYAPAWELQREVGSGVRQGRIPDTVLTVEHGPVYTVGRSARGSLQNLLWDAETRQQHGIALYEVDRGGDITYHGPGQVVVYPVIDLTSQSRDLHRYLRNLEEAIIRTLAEFDIRGVRLPPHTGVWVGEEKIAAIGVKASHWITQHGLALNVDPCLEHFQGIVACGIEDKGVTSMRRVLGRSVPLTDVLPWLLRHLGEVLHLDLTPVSLPVLVQSLDRPDLIS